MNGKEQQELLQLRERWRAKYEEERLEAQRRAIETQRRAKEARRQRKQELEEELRAATFQVMQQAQEMEESLRLLSEARAASPSQSNPRSCSLL